MPGLFDRDSSNRGVVFLRAFFVAPLSFIKFIPVCRSGMGLHNMWGWFWYRM